MPVRTHVILDGLVDPRFAQQLSARWAEARFINAIDIGGQSAWLEKGGAADGLSEDDIAHVADLARQFGVEIRDRVGETFVPDNDLPALRQHMAREYRVRLAQSIVFGLPALIVHYLGPMLARGGGQSAGSLIYPWVFELILVGWTLWVAGLPILWQGGLAMIHRRLTGDLLTTVIVLAAFLPSVLGVASFFWSSEPWMPGGSAPAFHIALAAVMLALLQRWRMWKRIEHLAGRGNLMLPRFGRLVGAWLLAATALMAAQGWHAGLAFALLLPPMLSAGGINRRNPGWLVTLPVLVFAPVFALGPGRFDFAPGAEHVRFEIAAGFALIMTLAMAWGWRKR